MYSLMFAKSVRLKFVTDSLILFKDKKDYVNSHQNFGFDRIKKAIRINNDEAA